MKRSCGIILVLVACAVCPAQDISLSIIDTIYLEVPESSHAIRCLSSLGDFNRNGFEDFGVSFFTPESTFADIYYGNAGMEFSPSWRFKLLRGTTPDEVVGVFKSIENIGDVNGDGYEDLAIGAPYYFSPYDPFYRGRIWVFYGGAVFDETPDFGWSDGYVYYHYFGTYIADLGDWNGDSCDEFAVSAPFNDTDAMGQVYLIWGNNPLDSTDFVEWSGTVLGESFGNWMVSADFHGDSIKELLIWGVVWEATSDTTVHNIFIYTNIGNDTLMSLRVSESIGSDVSCAFSVIKQGTKDIAFFNISATEYSAGYRIENTAGVWDTSALDYDEIFPEEDTSTVIRPGIFHELKDLNSDGLSEILCQPYGTSTFYILDPADNYNVMFDSTFFETGYITTLDYNNDGFDEVFAVEGNRIIVLSTNPELIIREIENSNEISLATFSFGSISIHAKKAVNCDLDVFDITGRIVERRPLLLNKGKNRIQLNDHPNGVYFYRAIFENNQMITGKTIIIK